MPPNCAYYYFRHMDTDSDRQDQADLDHSDDLADDLFLDEGEDTLLLDHDECDAGRAAAPRARAEGSTSDTDEEWTYHAQGQGSGSVNGHGNVNVALHGYAGLNGDGVNSGFGAVNGNGRHFVESE